MRHAFVPSRILTLTALLWIGFPGLSEPPHDPVERVRHYFTVCLNSSDLDCLEEYWPAAKVDGVRKSESFRRYHFPDLHYTVREVVMAGERVVVIARITGHHGEAPEGELEMEEVYLYTLVDGRFTKGEVFSDRLTVSQALGYRVVPPDDGP